MLHSHHKFFVKLLTVISLRSSFVGVNLVTGIFLARVLGQADYGIYTYTVALAAILTIPASFGFDRLLVREVSIYTVKAKWGQLRGLLQWSNRFVLAASIGLVSVILTIVWSADLIASPLKIPISVGLLYIPVGALRSLRLAVMKGLDQVTWSLIPEWVITPIILIGVVSTVQWISPASISAISIIVIYLTVMVATLGLGSAMLRHILPKAIQQAAPQYDKKSWIIGAFPMMILGGLQIIHTRIDILMLGMLRSTDDVAIYSAVLQGTQFTGVILLSANVVIATRIASLYAENNREQLQYLVIYSARTITVLSCLSVTVLVGFGSAYLRFFGDDYVQGWGSLVILSLGQLVNAATGSVGVLLTMTGHERYMVISTGLSAILNVLLNTILIPLWGLNGAALATTISLIFINTAKSLWVARTLRLNATCFGNPTSIS